MFAASARLPLTSLDEGDRREHAHCGTVRCPGSRSRGVTVNAESTRTPGLSAPAGGLARSGHFIARYRWSVIVCWILLTLVGAVAAGKLNSRWYQSTAIPGKPAYETGQRVLRRSVPACVRRTWSSSTLQAATSPRAR